MGIAHPHSLFSQWYNTSPIRFRPNILDSVLLTSLGREIVCTGEWMVWWHKMVRMLVSIANQLKLPYKLFMHRYYRLLWITGMSYASIVKVTLSDSLSCSKITDALDTGDIQDINHPLKGPDSQDCNGSESRATFWGRCVSLFKFLVLVTKINFIFSVLGHSAVGNGLGPIKSSEVHGEELALGNNWWGVLARNSLLDDITGSTIIRAYFLLLTTRLFTTSPSVFQALDNTHGSTDH